MRSLRRCVIKWFKHISDSLDDPFIQDLMDEFGSDGYLVFFGTLEMLSREFDIKNPGIVTLPHNYIRRKLRLSWHKISTIYKFCEEEGRFFVTDNGRKITINCPKLKDLCDDWTKKLLRSNSEVTFSEPLIEEEVEEEKEEDKKKEPYIETSDEVRLSRLLLEKIINEFPTHRFIKNPPSIQSWAKHVDLMIRRDGRSVEQIEYVVNWLYGDNLTGEITFEVQGTQSVRKKFDKIVSHLTRNRKGVSHSKQDKAMKGTLDNMDAWLKKKGEEG
jgi:hypothetical protein